MKAEALNHEDASVRRRAAVSLKSESGPEALKVKAQALMDDHPFVRRRAALSLSSESGQDALKVKAQALNHQDPYVRKYAAESLSNESGPDALKLKALALKDPEHLVRVAAAQSLNGESGPEAERLRQLALKDSDPDVRAAAAKLQLALKSSEVRNPADTVSVEEARQAIEKRVKALSDGRSARDFRLSKVDVRFDERLPEGLEAQTRLTPDRVVTLSFRLGKDGRVSREALDEELRHLEQIRKNPEKILAQTMGDASRVDAMEAQIKKARGVEASGAAAQEAVESIQQLSDSLAPPSDPLCQGCLPASGSASVEGASLEELARKMAGKTPEQMRRTPGFPSACQRHFGAFF